MLTSDRQKKQEDLLRRAERVKEHVTIVEVLSTLGVDYNKSKGKILCLFPDHQERTGSMKVYERTNSAHCFGCGRSADVITIVQLRASTDGKKGSLGQAVRWLEKTFNVEGGAQTKDLNQRLSNRLKGWRAKKGTAPVKAVDALGRVLDLRDTIQRDFPREVVLALAHIEDYLWDELDRPGTDVATWERWASSMLRGTYTKQAMPLVEAASESLHELRSSSREPDPFGLWL